MSRKARKTRDPELFDVAAGRRMAEFFDRARANLGLSTDYELWKRLGIGRDTAQAWMRGERPPSREAGDRVAARLGITYADLLAIYEGRQPAAVDGAALIAAFEWAIQQVRAGQVPPEVRATLEKAAARSKRRLPTRPRGA